MVFQQNKSIVNRVAEFHDKTLEPIYFEAEMRGSIKYVRYLLLLCGLIFLGIGVFDHFDLANKGEVPYYLILRLGVFFISILMFSYIDRVKNPHNFTLIIAVYELLVFFVYIGIFLIYNARSLPDHTLAITILVISVFFLPGRWVLAEAVGAVMVITFMILSAVLSQDMNIILFARTTIYLVIAYTLMSISSFRINRISRLQFYRQSVLEKQSIIDKLTGVFNRARFDEALEEWTRLFQRYRTPFSLIMFDLDNYKRVNDIYGHIVGDEVLQKCANEVRRNIRGGDIFARWGGEEFVILMPYNNLQSAYEQAERLRKRIEQIDLGVAGRITACFGVTEIKNGDTAEKLIQRVDKLMYVGKRSGKNIVIKGMDLPNADKK